MFVFCFDLEIGSPDVDQHGLESQRSTLISFLSARIKDMHNIPLFSIWDFCLFYDSMARTQSSLHTG